MTYRIRLALGALALCIAAPAGAEILVREAYARASGPNAISGAAFMVLENTGARDDRLVAAASDSAERVELHTHLSDPNGVMRMVEVEDGFAVPAGQTHALARGGDHVMLIGLTRPLAHGDTVTLQLTFEQAGTLELTVPVDLERMPAGHGTGHRAGGHGAGMSGH